MTIRKQILILLLAGSSAFCNIVLALPQEELLVNTNEHKSIEDNVASQIKTLRMITLDILNILKDGRIPHKIDEDKLRDWVLQFDGILQQLETYTPVIATAKAVIHCTKLLKTAFQEKFAKLPHCSKETIEKLVIEVPDEQHEQALTQEVTKLAESNEKEIKYLSKQSRSFGHTLVNRCARNFENFVKHSFITRLVKTVLIGATCWWLGKKLFTAQQTQLTLADGQVVSVEASLANKYAREVLIGGIGAAAAQFGGTCFTGSRDWLLSSLTSLKRTGNSYWERIKGTPSILDGGYQHVEENDTILSDKNIIGLTRQLEELRPLIQIAFNAQGYMRKNQKVQRSFLFQGPSGCGKTYLAFYLKKLIEHTFAQNGAQQQSVRFRVIQRQELSFKFLSEIIAEERNQGGVVILFIDELHLLQPQDNQNPFILNEFLTEMTALHNSQDPQSQIFIIGATNSPEKLDVALTVAGRFKPVNFDYPNAATRREFFEVHLIDTGFLPTPEQLESYVRQTEGKSFADIRRIIECKQGSGEILNHEHIQAAIFTELYRFVNTLEDLNATEKRIIALHQASKAIAHAALGCEEYLEWVTISGIQPKIRERNLLSFDATKANPNDPKPKIFGALICHNLHEALHTESQDAKIKRCKRLLAGICGQELMTGTHSTTYHSDDITNALALAQDIILHGKPLKDLSERRQNEIRDEAERLLDAYRKEVTTLLTTHKAAIATLAQQLEEKTTIAGAQVQALIKGK